MKIKPIVFVTITIITIINIAISSFLIIQKEEPLRRSEEQIRSDMLSLTPIGTSMDDVLKVIDKNRNWKIRYISYERGIWMGELGKSGSNVGQKSIRVFMGKFKHYLIFFVNVDVFWAFDENSKLVDIVIEKQGDGY